MRQDRVATGLVLLALAACGDATGAGPSGPAAVIQVAAGMDQSARAGSELPNPLVVSVEDAQGRPVPNQVVNFRVVSGGGSVFAGAAQTNAEGRAQERWTLGTVAADSQRVEVRAVDPNTGTAQVFAVFRADAVAGPAAAIEKSSSDPQGSIGGHATPAPRVRVVDQYGNPVSGAAVTFAVTSGGGSVSGASSTTDTAGLATVGSWKMGPQAGANTLTATAAGVAGSIVFNATTLPPSQLLVSASNLSATVGQPVTLRAQLADANGVPVALAGQDVQWTQYAGQSGRFSPAQSLTDSAGVATTTFTPDTILQGAQASLLARDPSPATRWVGYVTLQVGPAAAAKLAFTTPPISGAGAGVPLPKVRVAVQDQYGNPVSHAATVTIALGANPTGALLGGVTSAATVDSVASFSTLTVDRTGQGYTLTASAAGLQAATSPAFDLGSTAVLAWAPSASNLVLSDSSLYFTTRPSFYELRLFRVSTRGGPVTAICTLSNYEIADAHVWVDQSNAYISRVDGGNQHDLLLFKVNRDGGTPTQFGGNGGGFGWATLSFAFDSTYLYYSGAGGSMADSGTYRVRTSDGAATELLPGARAFTVANGFLYYLEGTEVKRMPSGGGASTILGTGVGGDTHARRPVIAAAGRLFWPSPDGSSSASAIQSVPIGGGAVTTPFTGLKVVSQIVSDGQSLYVVDSDYNTYARRLLRFNLSTLAMTIMLSEPIGEVVVDDQYIYWTNPTEGTVKRAPK
jgi:hypothetical protein